jgi:hypothetical protein
MLVKFQPTGSMIIGEIRRISRQQTRKGVPVDPGFAYKALGGRDGLLERSRSNLPSRK